MAQTMKGVTQRYLGNFTTANLPTSATLPTLEAGDLAYDTTTQQLKVRSGGSWVGLAAGASITRQPAFADIGAAPTQANFNALLASLRAAGIITP